ncbi:hypothetical protein LOAG_13391, partial [Loa loa]
KRTQKEHINPKVTGNRSPRELRKGKDGVIRAAIIETPYREHFTRLINMSYPLEVNNESGIERKETKNKPEKAEEPIALRTRSKK